MFEGWVASEITKHRLNRGQARNLYYFRDKQGLEVDFLLDQGNRKLALLEAKATQTPMPDDARALHRLANVITGYDTTRFLVHAASRIQPQLPLSNGVTAVDIRRLHSVL